MTLRRRPRPFDFAQDRPFGKVYPEHRRGAQDSAPRAGQKGPRVHPEQVHRERACPWGSTSWAFYRIHALGIGTGLFMIGCSMLPQLVILQDPLTVAEHLKLGVVYEDQGEWEHALSEYQAVLQEDSQHLQALINIGNVYAQLQQYKEAEDYYRRALRLNPDHPMANNNLAWIMAVQGVHLTEAESLIGRAMSSDPRRWSVYFDTLAHLYLRQGRFSKAMSSIKEAEEYLTPEDETLRAQLISTRDLINQTMESGVNPPSSVPAASYSAEDDP